MASSAPGLTDLVCQQRSLVLALGTISPPAHSDRRMAQRLTWMRWPNVGNNVPGALVCGIFVVRAGGAPRRQAALLESWGQTCTNELAGLGKIPIFGRMHVGCHELIDGRRQIIKRALQ